MLIPSSWGWVAASHNVQPAEGFGTAVVPAQNAYGAYVKVMDGSLVTFDVWEVRIRINGVAITGQSRNALATLAIDTGAGYVDLVSHLLATGNGEYTSSGSIPGEYRFPVNIPAGAHIGFKGAVDNADLTAFEVSVVVCGEPTAPSAVWKGSFVRTFGENLASSAGTIVTPGQAVEGAWVELGTLAEDLYFWQVGLGMNDSSISSNGHHVDLGVGPANPPSKIAILNHKVLGTTAEVLNRGAMFPEWCLGLSGDKVFGRIQTSAVTLDTSQSLIAYAVGGDGGNTASPSPPPPPMLAPAPDPIEAPLAVAGVEAVEHLEAALSRLPHYLARLP